MRRMYHCATLVTGVALLSAGLFIGTAEAAGTTRYVSPSPPALAQPGTSCTLPGYNTIQAAINASSAGDTVLVCPGTYPEQVTVNRNVTLAGSGNSIIQAPAALAADADGKRNVVEVNNGASARMSGFTVAGPGPSGCGSIDTGIAVLHNATLNLSTTTVRDIRDEPFSGCQNGEGIRVGTPRFSTTGTSVGHATIDNVIVTDYQKNGITLDGPNTTAKITNTTVTGNGPTTVIAQNGIQVSRGAAATISTSTMRDHNYTPKGVTACGLLIFNASGVNDADNVYLNNERDKCTVTGRGGTFEG